MVEMMGLVSFVPWAKAHKLIFPKLVPELEAQLWHTQRQYSMALCPSEALSTAERKNRKNFI